VPPGAGIDRLGVGLGNPDARRLDEQRGYALVPASEHRVTRLAPGGHDGVYLMKGLA